MATRYVVSWKPCSTIALLTAEQPLKLQLEREGKIIEKTVTPEALPSGIGRIGLQMPGETYIQVNYSSFDIWSYRIRSLFGSPSLKSDLRASPYLKDGDLILTVEGERITTVDGLDEILGRHHGKTVSVLVEREKYPWLAPWPTFQTTVEVPTRGEFAIYITDLVDQDYGYSLGEQMFYSGIADHQRGLKFHFYQW